MNQSCVHLFDLIQETKDNFFIKNREKEKFKGSLRISRANTFVHRWAVKYLIDVAVG